MSDTVLAGTITQLCDLVGDTPAMPTAWYGSVIQGITALLNASALESAVAPVQPVEPPI